MIAQLRGVVVSVGATQAVVEVGGVGLAAQCTPRTTSGLHTGQEVTLFTSLVVREDSLTLYGFDDAAQRDLFELAQTASGVGPKLAQAIVAVLGPDEFAAAVTSDDLTTLCRVPGIGRKGAQKLVLELRDKVQAGPTTANRTPGAAGPGHWRVEVVEGLQGLGWSQREAEAAYEAVREQAEQPDSSVGTIMRAALAGLARR